MTMYDVAFWILVSDAILIIAAGAFLSSLILFWDKARNSEFIDRYIPAVLVYVLSTGIAVGMLALAEYWFK